jgi:hypothetical protein
MSTTKTAFVIGAGASYGAYSEQKRMSGTPLTADLFGHPRFLESVTKATALTNLLEQARRSEGVSFDLEKSLASLILDPSEERLRELMDLRFAIHAIIRETSKIGFGPFSNPRMPTLYEDLWFRVREYFPKGAKAAFVNMNYDSMLDAAISLSEGIGKLSTLDSCIMSPDWLLVHPHGSISWAYKVINDNQFGSREGMISYAPKIESFQIELTHLGQFFPEVPDSHFPALALPATGSLEKEKFVAPENHMKKLSDFVYDMDGLVVIGWRGLDQHINELLRDSLPSPLSFLHVVSGTQEGAQRTIEELKRSGLCSKNEVAIGGGQGTRAPI